MILLARINNLYGTCKLFVQLFVLNDVCEYLKILRFGFWSLRGFMRWEQVNVGSLKDVTELFGILMGICCVFCGCWWFILRNLDGSVVHKLVKLGNCKTYLSSLRISVEYLITFYFLNYQKLELFKSITSNFSLKSRSFYPLQPNILNQFRNV